MDPALAALIVRERERQETTLNLNAADNTAPAAVLEALGSSFNNKTAEGYPGRRYHTGCRVTNEMEQLAVERTKALFGAGDANVQPHSGVNANLAVYGTVLSPGDTLLSMELNHGGHLSRGDAASITGYPEAYTVKVVDGKPRLPHISASSRRLPIVTGRESPLADPVTGAAHLCVHHIQVASMLGAAMGLVGAGAGPHLTGQVKFLGCPAEEFLEIEYRLGLAEAGKISFLSGKQELIKLGYFDDVDAAMMVHAFAETAAPGFLMNATGNGFMAKFIRYEGKPSHAGATPHLGVNALNAACIGIMAVHAQRETFQDDDAIRVHPIITKGGDVVNVVPADVRLETYVRGKNVDAILDASRKVDRALKAGGDAVGATTAITNIPGYLPIFQDRNLTDLAARNGRALLGDKGAQEAGFMGGSFDVGDLSHLIPLALAMAMGICSASMMTAGAETMGEALPQWKDQFLAFAAASNLDTGITGLYASWLIGLPFVEWVYRVMGKKKEPGTKTFSLTQKQERPKVDLKWTFFHLVMICVLTLIGNWVATKVDPLTALPGMVFIFGDLRDRCAVGKICARLCPDHCLHRLPPFFYGVLPVLLTVGWWGGPCAGSPAHARTRRPLPPGPCGQPRKDWS